MLAKWVSLKYGSRFGYQRLSVLVQQYRKRFVFGEGDVWEENACAVGMWGMGVKSEEGKAGKKCSRAKTRYCLVDT